MWDWTTIGRNNDWILPKFVKRPKPADSRSWMNLKEKNPRKSTPRYIIIEFCKLKTKKKNLKSNQREIMY